MRKTGLFLFAILLSALSLQAQTDANKGTIRVRKRPAVELKDQEFSFLWKTCIRQDKSMEEKRACTWEAMINFVSKELSYPEMETPVEGIVTVKFRVDENGRVADASIAKGLHPDLNKEALRVVSKMIFAPNRRGSGTFFSFPIQFSLK